MSHMVSFPKMCSTKFSAMYRCAALSWYNVRHGLKLIGQNFLQLLRIEEELGDDAFYAGEEWRESS